MEFDIETSVKIFFLITKKNIGTLEFVFFDLLFTFKRKLRHAEGRNLTISWYPLRKIFFFYFLCVNYIFFLYSWDDTL